jgi:hypothetical protein
MSYAVETNHRFFIETALIVTEPSMFLLDGYMQFASKIETDLGS